MNAELRTIDLTKPASGGGGGGTDSYSDLTNKPKINSVTLSGNKSSSDLGLQAALVSGTNIKTINNTSILGSGNIDAVSDVQVNGTSVTTDGVANIPIASTSNLGAVKTNTSYGLNTNTSGTLIGVTRAENNYDTADSLMVICKGTLSNIQNTYVRSVSPACTTLSGTTATITANTTYAHAVSSSGCTYTLTTPSSTDVYSGFILMLDTTNSATIAFQTDGSPATSISISDNPTIETGKKYTVTGQFSPLSNAWELFIISYEV